MTKGAICTWFCQKNTRLSQHKWQETETVSPTLCKGDIAPPHSWETIVFPSIWWSFSNYPFQAPEVNKTPESCFSSLNLIFQPISFTSFVFWTVTDFVLSPQKLNAREEEEKENPHLNYPSHWTHPYGGTFSHMCACRVMHTTHTCTLPLHSNT